jgi:Zn-dependent alcohol dehydrogenase
VGLLGCGIMAGIGAAINTGEVKRGESVAVIGCGGVGIAAVAGARLAGATTIIAVDIDDNKIDMAKSLGATHGVNSRQEDAVEAIRALTGGHGADVVIDAHFRSTAAPGTWTTTSGSWAMTRNASSSTRRTTPPRSSTRSAAGR